MYELIAGARSLRVSIVEGYVDGVSLGLAKTPENTIELAGDSVLDPKERLHVLAHEYCHHHEWINGTPPIDNEARADWLANFFVCLHRQVAANGGETALMRMRHDGTLTPADAIQAGGPLHPDEPYSCECPECEAMIGAGSVVRSIPVIHEGRRVRWLQAMCSECGSLWRWAQNAEEGSEQYASWAVAPFKVEKRHEVAQFCRDYPKQAGVVMGDG